MLLSPCAFPSLDGIAVGVSYITLSFIVHFVCEDMHHKLHF